MNEIKINNENDGNSTVYQIEMQKIDRDWIIWDTVDERPTRKYCEAELVTEYCLRRFNNYRIFKIDRCLIKEGGDKTR